MKMLKNKILLLFFVVSTILFSQTIESVSGKTSLRVKFGPPDHIPPVVHAGEPTKNIIANLPIYTKDSLVHFLGDWSDNSADLIFVTINDTLTLSFSGKNYDFKLHVPYGVSKFNISFEDYKKNSYKINYVIERNDTIDYDVPQIIVTEPKIKTESQNRGIKISRIKLDTTNINETNRFIVRGLVKEKSGIYSFSINDIDVPLDTNMVFNWSLPEKPDYLKIRAVDNFGNEAISEINLKNDVKLTPADLIIGNYYALIIGIQNYNDKNIPSLDFPLIDAKNLKQVLLEHYSFKESNVELLADPTRKEIIQKLKELRMKLTKEDNLIIFYAGHGYWDEDLQQGFWLPSDASLDDDAEWLSNGRVRDYIRGINTKHTLLVADACFSGGIFKSRKVSLTAPKSIQEMYNAISRRAMTSGTLNEVPDKSVFMEYLTKRLKDNTKEFLSSEELFYSLKEAVINNSPIAQTPEYGVIHQAGDEGGGSFIFIRKKNKK
jgi:hypothetical protein